MNKFWIPIFVAMTLLLAACGAENSSVEPVLAANSPPATTMETEVAEDAFTLENLRFYDTRVYYLREGENLSAVASWVSDPEYSSFSYDVVMERLIELNPNNIITSPNGELVFMDSSELAPVNIPYLPNLPSNQALGIMGPSQEIRSHIVQEGENLTFLAYEYGFNGDYEAFASATRIHPDSILQVGQMLTWTVDLPARYIEGEN